jgi:replicative DNA helicase
VPAPHEPTTTARPTATSRAPATPANGWTDIPLPPEPPDETRNGHRPRHPADEQPHDKDAEKAVLGAALQAPDLIPELTAILEGHHFHHPAHTVIWHTISDRYAAGEPVDVLSIAPLIETHRTLAGLGGRLYLHDLAADPSVIPASATWHARIVAARAEERRVLALATKLTQTVHSGAGTEGVAEMLGRHLAERNVAERARVEVRDIDTFLHTDDDGYDWVVPGLLERHDRLMLTGPEGGGKSTFCRQFAIMTAAGIHPFSGEVITPARVLYLDLENSERQSRRKLRPLRLQAGSLLDPDRLRIEVRPSGIDLLDPEDSTWVLALVDAARPDILITGPIYRMASGDPIEEKTAKPVSQTLDRVRERGCAVVIETHTPHAAGGQRKRPLRPYGASLWLRWPEFGIHLSAEGEVEHWRGPRDEREWPTMLARGGHWPWTPVADEAALRWHHIKSAREKADVYMSERDVVEATGIAKTTVHRVLEKYRFDWLQLNGKDPS